MKSTPQQLAHAARLRLVEVGGRTAQDLGLGRILGQVLVYLYLWDGECSLDQLETDLGLSKAAVSVTARQLENLGLVRRVWKTGDRKRYYRTADNIGTALQQGLLALIRRKIDGVATELDAVHTLLAAQSGDGHAELKFLAARVKRAKVLRDGAAKVLGSPLLRLLVPSR